jgi:hypothetical protein
MNVRYLNYYANYSWNIKGLEIESASQSAICFSRIYSLLGRPELGGLLSGNVNIFVNKSLDFIVNKQNDNYCILDKNELNYYLRFLNKFNDNMVVKKVKAKSHISNDNFTIELLFKNVRPYEIRLMMALVRNMYEVSYSLQTKLAFLMKNLKEFKKLDFSERLCLSINSISVRGYGHSIYGANNVKLINNNDLIERYKIIVPFETEVNNFLQDDSKNYEIIRYDDISVTGIFKNEISDILKDNLIENYKKQQEE